MFNIYGDISSEQVWMIIVVVDHKAHDIALCTQTEADVKDLPQRREKRG